MTNGCRESERSLEAAPAISAAPSAATVTPERTTHRAIGAATVPPPASRYDPRALLSPITAAVAHHLAAIAGHGRHRDDVFMKVGDSGTASGHFLRCFARRDDPRYEVDLGLHPELATTLEIFRGNGGGPTPFDRVSRAAVAGKTAGWVLAGSPSPLETELDALDPRYAFVGFGTNDLHYGPTPRAALPTFHAALDRVLARLESDGIVPLVAGLPPRDHDVVAERWVPTYDAMTRGLAEQRQVPYLSLYRATRELPDRGLVRDGVHGNAYRTGSVFRPCVFTPTGLAHHYNVRNLLSLQQLSRVHRVLVDGAEPPDTEAAGWSGEGTRADPHPIDRLPYTHSPRVAATTTYTLTVDEPTPVRLLVLGPHAELEDRCHPTVTADGTPHHPRWWRERTLEKGSHRIEVIVPAAREVTPRPLLVVVRCEPDDRDCRGR